MDNFGRWTMVKRVISNCIAKDMSVRDYLMLPSTAHIHKWSINISHDQGMHIISVNEGECYDDFITY